MRSRSRRRKNLKSRPGYVIVIYDKRLYMLGSKDEIVGSYVNKQDLSSWYNSRLP
jgi:hypothetical protein